MTIAARDLPAGTRPGSAGQTAAMGGGWRARSLPALRLSDGLSMPLDAVTETLGIFGQKGSGKSSTSALFVEQGVKAGGRFVIADPTGVWWGLMHDGAGPGLPGIVFGGEHADVPLEATAGHVVAEFVVQQDEYPVVVLDMKLMRKADRTRFMLTFLETLYHDNREALHVVLDESHQFAPTQAREGGDQIKLLGAVEDVVALGRSRGLGITMISQRFATLNANVREQIGTLVVHRLVGSLDRKALKGWIEANADPAREKEVLDTQAKLKTAQALVWSPAFLEFFGVVNMDAPVTFDSRATPKVGQRVKKPGKRAAVNLDVLRERMAETIEQARENDPGDLRKRLRDAEERVRKQAASIEDLTGRLDEAAAAPPQVQVVSLRDDLVKALAALRHFDEGAGRVATAYEAMVEVTGPIAEKLDLLLAKPEAPPAGRGERESRSPAVAAAAPSVGRVGTSADAPPPTRAVQAPRRADGVTAPQQKILDAIAWFEAIGVPHPRRVVAASVAGVSAKSSGFRANVSTLSGLGLVAYPAQARLALTEEGRAIANPPAHPPTREALQDAVCSKLSGPQATLLRVLIEAWPNEVTREVLAARGEVSPLSSGFRANVSTLSGWELVSYPSQGTVRADDVLFP